jgi:hypothetical protein
MATYEPRRAALVAALLCALAVNRASAAVTCPSSGATGTISCYGGGTFTPVGSSWGVAAVVLSAQPTSGATCDCHCGPQGNGQQVGFTLVTTSYCDYAMCAAAFPNYCSGMNSVAVSQYRYGFDSLLPGQVSTGPGSICYSYTVPCTTTNGANYCLGVTSGTATYYGYLSSSGSTANGALQQCNNVLSTIASVGGTVNVLCTTSNCNAPPSPPSPPPPQPASSAAAVVAAPIVVLSAAAAAATWL